MSLSKPFPLSHLPLVPLEQVLLLLDPRDLLLFALSSENARELLRKFSLVKYFDINVKNYAVIFSFRLNSGKLMRWTVRMCPSDWELKKPTSVFELDDMRMDLFKIDNDVRCELPKEYFSGWTQRIGYFLLSIFPCRRIRKFGAGKVGLEDEKVFFYMDRIASCEKFRFFGYDGDNMLEILDKTDVKRKITLNFEDDDLNLEWMNNEKIRNISRLKLVNVRNLSDAQFLSLENEHLHLEGWEVIESALNAYLKKWVNGEFTKRRTLKISDWFCQRFEEVIDGLTIEPVETWEKLGKPRHVQFSNKFYLKPIPHSDPWNYETVLLRNCNGQFATIVQTSSTFYFTPWELPIPPINIPVGYKLYEYDDCPFIVVFPKSHVVK